MAERRMFTKKITESDSFLDMPKSTQCLYFHLNMNADDDGFINNPKKTQRMIGCSDDDMKLLIAKKFIIPFESGVVVIKHWLMHNLIRKDRYTETDYVEEKNMLKIKKSNAYSLKELSEEKPLEIGLNEHDNQMATKCQPNDNQMATVGIRRIGKDRLGKDSIVKDKKEKDKKEKTFASLIAYYSDNPELIEALTNFVEMRKKMKGYTVNALELGLKHLDELALDDKTKTDIVNQSIERGWRGLFPLKNKYSKTTDDFLTREDEPF